MFLMQILKNKYYFFYFLVTANIGALGLAAVRNSSTEAVALPRVKLNS
jgi:hypothetical protein